ncbi:Hsp20/alpha crystallin family protein [Thermodesulfitimonas autotrophica]|uniref:Hsp20/alpha crystallin family protein n=1 Tax=Thermodesulfitimonas autotrophica TaxID=1894989 RepID=UPI002FDFEF7E
MYIQTFNPNQAVALSQGYRAATTAIPVAVRPSPQGNTVVYSFNPALAQGLTFNPMVNPALSLAYNPAMLSSAALANPFLMGTAWANPALATGMMTPAISPVVSAWNPAASAINPAATAFANPALQQAYINPFLSGQFMMGLPGATIQSSAGLAQMRVDLHETNSDVVVAAELPNVSLNDLNLTVTDDSLSISATAFAGGQVTSLFRTIALPCSIKSEQVEATYSNGILEIRAPKADVATRRRVKINVV